MCTAISYKTADHYFGRNLDLEYHYNETVVITPRKFPLNFRCMKPVVEHYAFIGMATVDNGYPLYYEATNEHGLSMAGLNFPHWAVYQPVKDDTKNIAPFELIPWLLCQCKSVLEAKDKLKNLNIASISYSAQYPLTPLHWMLADKSQSIVLESTEQGLQIHDNPVGVLTNSPDFSYHIHNLTNYRNLTNRCPENRFCKQFDLKPHSAGIGAVGLPGDFSSASRFIRACFTKLNSVAQTDEESSVNQFFHILSSVAIQNGCVVANGSNAKTIYSSCCNTDKCIYYYTTYENSRISAVSLFSVNLDTQKLYIYPLIIQPQIYWVNFLNQQD